MSTTIQKTNTIIKEDSKNLNADDRIILNYIDQINDGDNIGSDIDYQNFTNSEIMDISLEERANKYSQFDYMETQIKEIKEINIREFNFDQFKEDINDMKLEFFNMFFNEKIMDLFYDIEEDYLFLNYEQLDLLNHKPLIKDTVKSKIEMVEIIVDFYMFKLPYVYFPKMINNHKELDLYDLINDVDLKDKLIKTISEDNNSLRNLSVLLNSLNKTAQNKKMDEIELNKRALDLENLNNNLNKKANINYYYTNLINSTSTANLQTLLFKYIDNDITNILV